MSERLRRLWRRHGRTLLLGAGMLVLLVVLVLVIDRDAEEEAPPEYPQVEALVVHPVDFEEWIETTGTIEARADALLTAETGGTVTAIAEEGQAVQAGQIVARLDPGQAEAAVRQAQAAAAEARAGVQQTEQAFQRQLPLVEDTIISPLEFDQVRAQRQQARAGLAQALAAQAEAEQLLERTRLRAPFAGVVERRWVRVGEQVGAGQEVIRIIGPGLLEVEAGIPERFAGDIGVGTPATVRLNAYGLGDFSSTVSFVGNAVDPQSRTFPVRIEVADPQGVVKPEMIARVRVVRRVVPGAIVLPREAVVRDPLEESVLVVSARNGLGVVQRRTVVTGPESEQGVLIVSGLRAGEQVVILGQDQVVGEDEVQIIRRYPGLAAYRAAVEAELEAAR